MRSLEFDQVKETEQGWTDLEIPIALAHAKPETERYQVASAWATEPHVCGEDR